MRRTLNNDFDERRRANLRRPRAAVTRLRLAASRLRVALFAFSLLPFAFLLSPPTARAAGAWAKQNSGTLAWLRGVHFTDARAGWAVGGRGVVLRTVDGGASWKLMPRPTEDTLRDVHFTDASTGWLVCAKDDFAPRAAGEPRSYLMRTNDAGLSWARVRPAGADDDVRFLRVVFADAARGWVFGEAGALYATRDGGANWTRQTVPTRHLLLGGAFLDARRGWLVGAGSTFVQTDDGGDTWHAGSLEALARGDDGTSNAVASSDSVNKAAARPRVVSADAGDASNVNAASRGARVSARVNAVSFADARRGLAVGASGRVFATADGGRTWRAQSSGVEANLHDVKLFEGGEAWAAGERGTLLHTTDGGARWTRVAAGTSLTLERLCFAGRSRAWAVGFGGVIISLAPSAVPRLKQISSN